MTKELNKSPRVIVLGNSKGGTGKSTVGMHVIVFLLRNGKKVGSIDLDAGQGTLSRYIQNREMKKKANPHLDLPLPIHEKLFQSFKDNLFDAMNHEKEQLEHLLYEKLADCDYIVLDTPGSDNHLSRLGHAYANILVTPLNDSFVDLDLLVRLNDDMTILHPSTYSEMVWEQKKKKMIRDKESMNWIVLRNRINTNLSQSKSKFDLERILIALSKRIGFSYISGFGDRVIFRELFLSGLTLLDMRENNMNLSLSHIAAKQELLKLMECILVKN